MTLNPNYVSMTREQTFSGVAKGTVHIPIALDNSYPAGGYAVDSSLLFNADGYTFHMVNGYAVNGAGAFLLLFHDVANSKLRCVVPTTGLEVRAAVDLSGYTAYCTFHRW